MLHLCKDELVLIIIIFLNLIKKGISNPGGFSLANFDISLVHLGKFQAQVFTGFNLSSLFNQRESKGLKRNLLERRTKK